MVRFVRDIVELAAAVHDVTDARAHVLSVYAALSWCGWFS